LANLHFALSISLFHSGQLDEAISAAKRATEEYQRHNNLGWIKTASFHARLLTVKGRLKTAAAHLDEVVTAAQESRHGEQFRAAMFDIGSCWMILRDPIKARRFFTMGMERKGITAVHREIHFGPLAAAELMAGDLRRAKSIVAEHDALPSFRINIPFREGNWNAAIEMAQVSLDFARRVGNRWEEINALWQLCQLTRVAGDLERAAEYLAQSLHAYDAADLLWEMRNRPEAALLAIEMGRPDEALQHLEVCRTILAQGEDWCGMISPVERAEGILAAVQGDDFAPHFERSIAVSKRYSLRWDEADTLHDWGCRPGQQG
jgi:tetratricopeptide (TPR) repeat protein